MKTPLAFLILAIFSLFLLCSTADGRKYPEKYWGKGRNLRMLEEGEGLLGTSSEPVSGGGGGGGGGDPKEEEPLGTSSEPIGSGAGGGSGGDPKEEKPRGTSFGGGGDDSGDDPKKKRSLLFGYRGPQIPVNY